MKQERRRAMIERLFKSEVARSEPAVHGGEALRYGRILDFSSNVNPLGMPESAIAAVKRALWKCAYYPEDSQELREAAAQYFGAVQENVLLGSGSTELIKIFCEGFLNRGEEALVLAPSYSDYEVFAKLQGVKINRITLRREDDFAANKEEIISRIHEKTKVLFLCSPNNPTGQAINNNDLEEIISKAGDCNSLVFLDEAYIDFSAQRSFCERVEEFDNLFVLRSLTKFFAIPGLRIGCAVAGKKAARYLERLLPPWNVNALAQAAALAALKDASYVKKSRQFVKRERDFLYGKLKEVAKVYPSEANFFLVELRNATAPELKKKLLARGMLVRDCSSFAGLSGRFIRVCVRKREENLRLIKELAALCR